MKKKNVFLTGATGTMGWAGLQELLKHTDKINISILATKRGKEIYPLPHPDHVFSETESLMILGRNEDVKRLIK